MTNNHSYLDEKVMTIKIVTEMTGLSERQVRYYETRELIFPKRNSSGTRMYSFSDIERLIEETHQKIFMKLEVLFLKSCLFMTQ